jgi:alkaline phosphatase
MLRQRTLIQLSSALSIQFYHMKKSIIICLALSLMIPELFSQDYSQYKKEKDSITFYLGVDSYEVKTFKQIKTGKKPKNVILMIGDGMGVSHVFSGLTANGGEIFLNNFKYIGFSLTQSSDNYITDSAAGGTALSTGKKTYNGAIAMHVDAKGDTVALKTVLEMSEEKGLATGLVATAAITHATPASFIAHQVDRNSYEAIAADFLKTDIDVFIGGGYKNFTQREDGRDLTIDLVKDGYQVLQTMEEIAAVKSGKLAGFTAFGQNKPYPVRPMDLPVSTETALNILSNNKKGFFLMVEGSQIDWASHKNNTIYEVQEMLDFDRAIGKALEFAANDGNTLIIVTADHETGGLAMASGDMQKGSLNGIYATGNHTGVIVPIFSYGPGADEFTGIMDNTDIAKNIITLLGL